MHLVLLRFYRIRNNQVSIGFSLTLRFHNMSLIPPAVDCELWVYLSMGSSLCAQFLSKGFSQKHKGC